MLVLKVVLKYVEIYSNLCWLRIRIRLGGPGLSERGGLKKQSQYMGHKQIFVCVVVCVCVPLCLYRVCVCVFSISCEHHRWHLLPAAGGESLTCCPHCFPLAGKQWGLRRGFATLRAPPCFLNRHPHTPFFSPSVPSQIQRDGKTVLHIH